MKNPARKAERDEREPSRRKTKGKLNQITEHQALQNQPSLNSHPL